MEPRPIRFLRNLGRMRQIVSVLLAYGFGDLVDRLHLRSYVRLGQRLLRRRSEPVKPLSRAQRVRLSLEELGPTFVKFGQVLSTRPDLIPADIVEELKAKARQAGLNPECVVLVATARALKWHGGAEKDALANPDPERVRAGLPNLARHLDSALTFGVRPIVAINRFADDTDEELAEIEAFCAARGVPVAMCDHFARGADGALDLARAVLALGADPAPAYRPIYPLDAPLDAKIRAVAREVYGADDVVFTPEAKADLRLAERLGLADAPVCLAKTPASLSDDPSLRGRPTGFVITVRELAFSRGAGFVVVLTGDILRMPGLPKRPSAADVDLVDGRIVGVG